MHCVHLQHSQFLGHRCHGGISVADGGMPSSPGLLCVFLPYARGEYAYSKEPKSPLLRSVGLLQACPIITFSCPPDRVPNPSHLEFMTFFFFFFFFKRQQPIHAGVSSSGAHMEETELKQTNNKKYIRKHS